MESQAQYRFAFAAFSCFFLAEGADGAKGHLFLAICSSVASVVLGAVASKLACAAPRRFYVTSGQLPALLLFIGLMARQTITYVRSLCAICSSYRVDLERDGVSLVSISSFLCAELYSFNFGFLSSPVVRTQSHRTWRRRGFPERDGPVPVPASISL